ncbi:MAG: type II secretion system GspH family protein [Candidatus Cloacimonetes bacterium]|nr:type II secretion system GspH family protein [Candidatus Cloacimonadota bacterium]
MSDNMENAEAQGGLQPDLTDTASQADIGITRKSKFSLIELLMIIMLVGIIITFVIPLQQMKQYKARTMIAVENITVIHRLNEDFKIDPNLGDGDYAFDISMLNILPGNEYFGVHPDTTYFSYFFDPNDESVIVAETKPAFGREGIKVVYHQPDGPYSVLYENESDEDIIQKNWLP